MGENLQPISGGTSLGSIGSSLGAYNSHSISRVSTGGSGSTSILSTPTDLTVDLGEYVTNEFHSYEECIQTQTPFIENSVLATVFKGANTLDMVWLAINDGTLRLTEKIADGAIWSTKATLDVLFGLGGLELSIFDPKFKQASDDITESVDGFFKDVITFKASDWVHDQLMQSDYIKLKNENSLFDYDGEASNSVANVSEFVQKYVGAAISSKVWGGALAIMLGGCYGSGEQAEKLYTEKEETSLTDELSILMKGVNEAATWYSVASMAKGFSASKNAGGLNLGKWGKEIWQNVNKGGFLKGLKSTNATITSSMKSILTSSQSNPFSKAFGSYITKPENIVRINNALFGSVDEYLSGEKDFNVGNVWKDINLGYLTAVIGGSRTNILSNAKDYTYLPTQGVIFGLKLPNFGLDGIIDLSFGNTTIHLPEEAYKQTESTEEEIPEEISHRYDTDLAPIDEELQEYK